LQTLIPLAFNIALAVILSCVNSVQSTTLRWALFREGRLRYNSNPRLFSFSKTHLPNHWSINILSAIATSLIYGAVNQMTLIFRVDAVLDPETIMPTST